MSIKGWPESPYELSPADVIRIDGNLADVALLFGSEWLTAGEFRAAGDRGQSSTIRAAQVVSPIALSSWDPVSSAMGALMAACSDTLLGFAGADRSQSSSSGSKSEESRRNHP